MNKQDCLLKFIPVFLGILSCLTLTSCHTYERFKVKGQPGTIIYTPDRKAIGSIGKDGNLQIKVPSDAYYGYLYTYNEADDLWIPFGINMKRNNHKGTKTSVWVGITVGVGTIVGPIISYIASDHCSQLSYFYNFGYEDIQKTNQDLKFTQYVPPILNIDGEKKTKQQKINNLIVTGSKKKSSKNKSKYTKKSNLKKTNGLDQYEGYYDCTGKILQDKQVVSTYKGFKLDFKLLGEREVEVTIYIDGSNKLFDEPEVFIYDQKKSSKKEIILIQKGNNSCYIQLSPSRILYKNSQIIIDDEEYELTVEGTRNK